MFGIIKGKSDVDCTEHAKLHMRINALETRMNIMQCEKHVWVEASYERKIYLGFSWLSGVVGECSCGSVKPFSHEKWAEIQLEQALDEVERLGGEVTR